MSPGLGSSRRQTLALHTLAVDDGLTLCRPSTLLWMAGMATLMVPMLTLVDIPTARWFASDPLPRELADILDLSRVFSHGSGVFMILLGLILMAPKRRWYVPRLAALAMGGGAVATITKMFVLRPRPSGLNLDIGAHDFAWLWAFDWTLEQVATFDANTRAFPSGNVATAIALSVGLWGVLPRGKWLFLALCIGAVLQRMACGAHFVSDLFGGAGCGLLWAYVCFHPKLLGNVFDKLEPEISPRRRRGNDVSPGVSIDSPDDDDVVADEGRIAA